MHRIAALVNDSICQKILLGLPLIMLPVLRIMAIFVLAETTWYSMHVYCPLLPGVSSRGKSAFIYWPPRSRGNGREEPLHSMHAYSSWHLYPIYDEFNLYRVLQSFGQAEHDSTYCIPHKPVFPILVMIVISKYAVI